MSDNKKNDRRQEPTQENDMNNERVVPYDTGKVKIGLLYTPPRKMDMGSHAEMLQRSLLDKPLTLAERIKFWTRDKGSI